LLHDLNSARQGRADDRSGGRSGRSQNFALPADIYTTENDPGCRPANTKCAIGLRSL